MRRYERLTPEGDQSDIASSTPRRRVPITILIADDHPVVRDGITTILSSQPNPAPVVNGMNRIGNARRVHARASLSV